MLKSLQGRLTILFLAFVLLVLVSLGAMMWGLETQRQDALIINLAGRQRMLAQQMIWIAYEMGEGENIANYPSLQVAEKTFEQTLLALQDGGTAPYSPGVDIALPAAQNPAIRSVLDDMFIVWKEYQTLLDELYAMPHDDPLHPAALRAIEDKSLSLVAQADLVVRLYEADATSKVNRLRAMQVGFLTGALILLGVGAWITRKSALEPLRELTRAANRLGENDLETAVQVEGPEEMRALSGSFDAMRQNLRRSRSDLLGLTSTLESRVAQRTHELEALNDVSREITSQLDVRHVLNSVTGKVRTLLNGDLAMLCLADEENRFLMLKSVSGVPSIEMRQEMSDVALAQKVLTSQQALICNGAECVGGCGLLAATHAESHVVAPLRIGDRVIGALCVSSSRANHFSKDSIDAATKLANTAAVALQNAQLYAQAEKVAALEERNRIAAEIHDGLGQTLSYLGLMTDQAMNLVSSGENYSALERLHKTRVTIKKATSDVRVAINSLMAESSPAPDLRRCLQETVEEFRKETGLCVDWLAETDVAPDCPNQAEQALNVTREALNNVARHAEAKHVTVKLGRSNDHYFVVVEDDGRGFDSSQPEPSGHFGLQIMRTRAAHIGGELVVKSAPGAGTRVMLAFPNGEKE